MSFSTAPSSCRRHRCSVLLAFSLCAIAAARAQTYSPDMAPPQDPASTQAQTILTLTNQDRAEAGLGPLRWDPALATAAEAHAKQMAATRELSHQFPNEPALMARASSAGAHFRSIAENVAMGPSPTAIEKQWMHSVPHRTNILDPQMDSIGIAVFASGGYLYAVQDFSASVKQMDASGIEDKVEQELREAGVTTFAAKDDARTACPTNEGTVPGSKATLVVRWESSDLALPAQLVSAIKTTHPAQAAVASCPATQAANQSFTTYRVAVLLY